MRLTATGTIASLILAQLAATPALAQDYRNLPPPGSSNAGEFAGTERCESWSGSERRCRVRTEGRVQLLQVESGRCREGRDWDYDRNGIRVRNGCAAVFGYGYAWNNQRPPNWNNDFAATIDCASYDRQQQRCYVNTQNRVQLLQDRSGRCEAGSSWGYTQDFIWVSRRCAAVFGYGYGYNQGGNNRPGHNGSSAGAVIGGVAVAAGLIALLAAAKSKNSQAKPGAGAAQVDADLSAFSTEARPAIRTCLDEAAKQIGSTGGTRLRLDGIDNLRRNGSGWAFSARATATYPDETHRTPFTCRATGSRVQDLTFSS